MRAVLLALVALSVAAPAASAVPLVGLSATNDLVYFDSANPATTRTAPITGLGLNESVKGIDGRPATGHLYAVTATAGSGASSVVRTYAIPHVAFAMPVGATALGLPGWGDVDGGWDFHPVADRGRVVNVNDENARINPVSGALAADDANLTPAATTTLVGAAYDRNVDGATATTLFAIDRNGSELVRIGGVGGLPSANSGAVTPIGPLGLTLDVLRDGGFDIAPDGTAYAALTDDADARTRLYTVDLATGAATPIGLIGTGAGEIRSLAVVLPEPPGPAGPAGAPGAQGAQGPAGAVVVRDRLAAALATDRFAGRAKRRLAVRFVTTVRALVTLELRRGSRVPARIAGQAGPGRARLTFKRLPRRGRYTLRLTAVAGSETVTDRARVRVAR